MSVDARMIWKDVSFAVIRNIFRDINFYRGDNILLRRGYNLISTELFLGSDAYHFNCAAINRLYFILYIYFHMFFNWPSSKYAWSFFYTVDTFQRLLYKSMDDHIKIGNKFHQYIWMKLHLNIFYKKCAIWKKTDIWNHQRTSNFFIL